MIWFPQTLMRYSWIVCRSLRRRSFHFYYDHYLSGDVLSNYEFFCTLWCMFKGMYWVRRLEDCRFILFISVCKLIWKFGYDMRCVITYHCLCWRASSYVKLLESLSSSVYNLIYSIIQPQKFYLVWSLLDNRRPIHFCMVS